MSKYFFGFVLTCAFWGTVSQADPPTFRINIIGQMPINSSLAAQDTSWLYAETFQLLYGNGNCENCRANPTGRRLGDLENPNDKSLRTLISTSLKTKMVTIPGCSKYLSSDDGKVDAVAVLEALIERQGIIFSPAYSSVDVCAVAAAGPFPGAGKAGLVKLYPGAFGRPFVGASPACQGDMNLNQMMVSLAHELWHLTDAAHEHQTQLVSDQVNQEIQANCMISGSAYSPAP